MTFDIVCICETDLEVEDMDTVQCPNCGRIYDDRGIFQWQEDLDN